MSQDTLVALFVFALVSAATPGPNNMMLLASGVNFGFLRTVPHMVGIGVGFIAMVVIVGLGLGTLMTASPLVHTAFQVGCSAYLLLMAWRLATSGSLGVGSAGARPMGAVQAALFQWINPKAWAMALTTAAVYVDPAQVGPSVATIALVFAAIHFPTAGLWTGFGTSLRGFLAEPARLKAFNVVMAVLLAGSVLPLVMTRTP
ncbi:LysE family translocator [Alsobacter sp. R-9]